jgi:glutamine amidotransferase PdxT
MDTPIMFVWAPTIPTVEKRAKMIAKCRDAILVAVKIRL